MFEPLYQCLLANSRIGTTFILAYKDRLFTGIDFFQLISKDFREREQIKIDKNMFIYIFERIN